MVLMDTSSNAVDEPPERQETVTHVDQLSTGPSVRCCVARGVGYALGPLVLGLLHDASGGWTLPLLFLLAVASLATIPATTLAETAFVEDDLIR
ncbi:hypothetical protein HQ312_18495 [Rhodococcus sp. BP-316]|uniref:hypothetical protein n=1 Tax=Rhodococcus sp. BP-316 TaxID=2739445 RepID=UPI001C9A5B10|nr:hypothetical protein [Rhodococcus sp. BP-316]MBY6683049.1 hypothetical protein [Rhodococcus sp. BP-316]